MCGPQAVAQQQSKRLVEPKQNFQDMQRHMFMDNNGYHLCLNEASYVQLKAGNLIILPSTSQHTTTWWSDRKLVGEYNSFKKWRFELSAGPSVT